MKSFAGCDFADVGALSRFVSGSRSTTSIEEPPPFAQNGLASPSRQRCKRTLGNLYRNHKRANSDDHRGRPCAGIAGCGRFGYCLQHHSVVLESFEGAPPRIEGTHPARANAQTIFATSGRACLMERKNLPRERLHVLVHFRSFLPPCPILLPPPSRPRPSVPCGPAHVL